MAVVENLGTTGTTTLTSKARLKMAWGFNNGSASAFVKLYDKATAATSSDTPVLSILVPAGLNAGFAFPDGVVFNAGLSVRATTGPLASDTGAPGSNEVFLTYLT